MSSSQLHRSEFLTNLEKCGLLDPAEFLAVVARLPATDRGRVLARYLVQDGTLTRFQAENLLANRTNGFVLGQYRILDELGRGGMGRVFKAEHLTMNRIVALKVLAPHLTKTERARQLFQNEVRAAAKLVHPHVVTAFDANRVGDRFFLVLEYIDGPNLAALIRNQGPLGIGQACEFIRQAAVGLQYAMNLGLVHRDIKPSNLLLQSSLGGSSGIVKITDFGLARLMGMEEQDSHHPDSADEFGSIFSISHQVMGTPDYLSPEQARNLNEMDIRSDIYSLGCTFYYLLTGEVPFPGGSTLEKLVRHSTTDPEPVEDLRPAVPPRIASLIRMMMAKNPADRPQTPREVVETLEPFSESRPVVWQRPDERSLGPASSIDLMATNEGSTTEGNNVLGGTLNESARLSPEELKLLNYLPQRPARSWNWLKPWAVFFVAATIGFLFGLFLIIGWRGFIP